MGKLGVGMGSDENSGDVQHRAERSSMENDNICKCGLLKSEGKRFAAQKM